MKKIIYSLSLLAIFYTPTLLLETGCSKDRIEEKPLNDYASPNDYLNKKKQQEQEFIIDTGGTCPLTAKLGTELCMAKTCLMLPNGDSVYFPYTLKIIEIYSPKDMIYAQLPTVASGEILETGGEIRVRTFKNGTELSLRPGCSYSVKMPNANTTPKNYMHTFYGKDSTVVNWTDSNSLFADSAGGYSNSIYQFDWLNCGVNRGSATNNTLSFVSKTDKLTSVAIFIYIPATKTVMQVYNAVSGNIPTGSDVKIIAIGVKSNGDLYKFYKTQTVNSNENIEVTMEAVSDANLTSLLDGL